MIDYFKVLLLESVVLLSIVETLALAVVVAVDRRRQSTGSRRTVWLALVVCVALLIVQHLVHTDRERIRAVVVQIADAIDAGDVAGVGDHLDDTFQDAGMDKPAWLADLRQKLQRWRIDEAKVGGFAIEVDQDSAQAWFRATCDWRTDQQSQSGVYSTWRLGFVRRDDGWKLSRVLEAKFGPAGMLDYTTIRQQ